MPGFVFVSCADERVIAGFALDANGRLREASRTVVGGIEGPSPGSLPLAVSADRRWLYAGLRGQPFAVVTFAVEADGTLREAGRAGLADSMCYLSTDAAGSRLFAASYGGNKVTVSAVADGIAGETLQVIGTAQNAHSIRLDPEGRFAYVACLGGDVILGHRFEGGTLADEAAVAARTKQGAGPRHLAFTRDGGRVYCLNELDATVNAYARDPATGGLRELQSVPVVPAAGKMAAADIHLTPDEQFLYASERGTNTLAGFRVDAATGSLTPIGTVPGEAVPRGFAITPDGRFLLVRG